MSEAKRCLPECGQPFKLCHKTSHRCYGDAHSCWCSPECRDNRRRMHEGEGMDVKPECLCRNQKQDVCQCELCGCKNRNERVRQCGYGGRWHHSLCRHAGKCVFPSTTETHPSESAPAPAVEGEPPRGIVNAQTVADEVPARFQSPGEPPEMTFAEAMGMLAGGRQVEYWWEGDPDDNEPARWAGGSLTADMKFTAADVSSYAEIKRWRLKPESPKPGKVAEWMASLHLAEGGSMTFAGEVRELLPRVAREALETVRRHIKSLYPLSPYPADNVLAAAAVELLGSEEGKRGD